MYIHINYFSSIINLLKRHILCTLGCILFILFFPAMISKDFFGILYTILALMVYFDLLYSACWELGSKHRRDINIHNRKIEENGCNKQILKYNYFSGLKLGMLYVLINVIICLICVMISIKGNNEIPLIANLFYKFWFAPFDVIFLFSQKYQYLLWFIIAMFPLIPISIGFISGIKGTNNFDDFVKKLVYKNK